MLLHLGKMTNKELAEWFGIKPTSYSRIKKKKLEELKFFADFEEVYGGVNITEIYEEEYKKKSLRAQEIVEKNLLEEWQNSEGEYLNTGANVARQMIKKYGNDLPYKPSTMCKIVREARMKMFGNGLINGEKGSCKMSWNKAVPIGNKMYVCMRLTEEEKQIKNELLREFYSVKDEKEIDTIESKMAIQELYRNNCIDAETVVESLFNIDNLTEKTWKEFLMAFTEKTGGSLLRTTELFVGKYLDEDTVGEFSKLNWGMDDKKELSE